MFTLNYFKQNSNFLMQLSLLKFSSFKSKADIIKNLNYENKMLFGPAKKKSKNKKLQKNYKQNLNEFKNNVEYNSERYWLIEYQKLKNQLTKNEDDEISKIELKSLSESLNEIKGKSVNGNDKKDKKLSSTSSSPALLPQSQSILEKNLIPFNDKQLKDMLKFPLNSSDIGKSNYFNNSIILQNDNKFDASTEFPLTLRVPSVGKILQSTMSESSRNALINWKIKKISELGEEGFRNFQHELLQQGKLFHKTLEEYLTSYQEPTELDPSITGVWNSVQTALESLKPKTELIEATVKHPYLKYCGIVDYVSDVRSNLCVIEWKKSNKIKDKIDLTYDAPLQLCAYLGALNYDKKYNNLNINSGYVVIAYTDGQPAQVHYLNEILLQKYWNKWLKRLQEYWIRFRDGTLPEPI